MVRVMIGRAAQLLYTSEPCLGSHLAACALDLTSISLLIPGYAWVSSLPESSNIWAMVPLHGHQPQNFFKVRCRLVTSLSHFFEVIPIGHLQTSLCWHLQYLATFPPFCLTQKERDFNSNIIILSNDNNSQVRNKFTTYSPFAFGKF